METTKSVVVRIAIVTVAIVLCAGPAGAANRFWQQFGGSYSGNWSDPNHWDTPPVAADFAFFNFTSPTPATVTLTGDTVALGATYLSGGNDRQLELQLAGNTLNSGTLNAPSSGYGGTVSATISSSAPGGTLAAKALIMLDGVPSVNSTANLTIADDVTANFTVSSRVGSAMGTNQVAGGQAYLYLEDTSSTTFGGGYFWLGRGQGVGTPISGTVTVRDSASLTVTPSATIGYEQNSYEGYLTIDGGSTDVDFSTLTHERGTFTVILDHATDFNAVAVANNLTIGDDGDDGDVFLDIDLNGVSPATGQIFDVMTYGGTRTGKFTLAAEDAAAWNVIYNDGAQKIQIEAVGGPITAAWNVDGIGYWSAAGNWDPNIAPTTNERTAAFGAKITASTTVIAEVAVTVKAVQFDNANTYAIAGTGSVNLEADSGNASVSVAQGDHQFQVVVNLNSSTDADVAASSSLAFNNALNLGGNTLTKTGDGTLAINNDLTTGGGSVIGLAGTITGGGSVGGDLTNTSATIAPGNSPGTLTVTGDFSQAAGGTLAIELAGTASGEFDVLAVTGSASLGGSLDITELYTPGGADSWTILTAGGGITGSFSAITAGYQVALANSDTELVLSLAGALLPGDANGDGCVDDLDLTALAVHWQQSTNLWEDGDFNGDGIVDDLDLTALAVNWQQGCGGGGSFADAWAAANVPEPTVLSLLALASVGLLRRRR